MGLNHVVNNSIVAQLFRFCQEFFELFYIDENTGCGIMKVQRFATDTWRPVRTFSDEFLDR